MKVSKGLEFPVVALPGVRYMLAAEEDEKEAARVFYVAATRATQRLVMPMGGNGLFRSRIAGHLKRNTKTPHREQLRLQFSTAFVSDLGWHIWPHWMVCCRKVGCRVTSP